jgi:hypothetical protein
MMAADSLRGLCDTTGTSESSISGRLGSYTASEEDGLSLLIHGSPISDVVQDDEEGGSSGLHLLDYESDNDGQNEGTDSQKDQSDYQVQRQEHAAMDTYPPREAGTDRAPQAESIPELDAVYYQCRSARTSMYKDTLISVSQDETFGEKNHSPHNCHWFLGRSRRCCPHISRFPFNER